ncbi:FtsX-like permease family protein [Oleiharenicola lentus]|uniref:FtsX-like permease family protein n=1 Tax=Oleiharenicola lentus TaxID=2508720 RepID=A0A4Q1CBS8_9BACT|nr:ABC transporter permease [Oleiharenicola lentus]RXK56362.1 FtsX-like permease family protein [Oleiharenicola lentus]
MDLFTYEIRLAARRIFRRRAQSAIILVTFAASVALALLSFALFRSIFLTDLSFDPGSRLLLVQQVTANTGANVSFSTPTELDYWRQHQTQFESFAPVSLFRTTMLTEGGATERCYGATLSSDAMRLLGAQPLLGRLFTAGDDQPGSTTVILSEKFWRTRFGADPSIVGRALRVEAKLATVVGVMPDTFRFPNDQQLWLPIGFAPQWATDYASSPFLEIIGRLKPGATRAIATAELARIAAESRAAGSARAGLSPRVVPLRDSFIPENIRLSARVLFALALLFVAGSCLNAANLVLIDFLGRTGEFGVASSLGLSRAALVRQLLCQIGLLALASTALALWIVSIAGPILFASLAVTLNPVPYWLAFVVDLPLVGIGAALGLLATLAAAIGPALLLLRSSPETLMRDGASGLRGSRRAPWRHALVTAQVAVLTLLAIFAGLLVNSQWHLARRTLGFDATNVLDIRIALNAEDFKSPASRITVLERLLTTARELPGVTAASLIHEDLDYYDTPNGFLATQRAQLDQGAAQDQSKMTYISEDFPAVARLLIIEGEALPQTPEPDSPNYALVTKSLAARLWPGQSALGRELWVRRGFNVTAPPILIVVRGIISDFQSGSGFADQRDAVLTHYAKPAPLYFNLLVRGERSVPSLPEVSAALRRAAPNVAQYYPGAWSEKLERQLQIVALTSRLTSIFAAFAGALCLFGIYGLTVSAFAQRTREFGIRLALGGVPGGLWRHFARGYLGCAMLGATLGLAIAASLAGALGSLLYGVQPWDGATYISVGAGMLALTAVACLPSLNRFRRLDPAICLRSL